MATVLYGAFFIAIARPPAATSSGLRLFFHAPAVTSAGP